MTDIASAEMAKLTQLAANLAADKSKRVRIVSYASSNDKPNDARRISLQRAIAVRKVLIDKGIEHNRINVQALGDSKGEGAIVDRVEVIPLKEGE
jgi:outer membrane protein OmpA-like peptidoglycan-associated protein